MFSLSRRAFLAAAPSLAAVRPSGTESPATKVALVRSTHPRLQRRASVEDPLDYETVRDMVWQAIRYAAPKAGSLDAKIPAGAWVVVKPNIVALRPRRSYRTGDITDMRVTKAVVEYVARFSKAARVTIAEGGSYRRVEDPESSESTTQNGVRVDARTFDWGTEEFPGFAGSLGSMVDQFGRDFEGKRFDYIDLSYDSIRDASGGFRRIEVPRSASGVGAFGERSDYVVTNTIVNCDFLISVPVMKVHDRCGITACLKNYVGTAPREFYAPPGTFSNLTLHKEHSLEERIDSFIVDLAAFHPPDFNVVDAVRGLQYTEHNNGRPDQMLRNNLVMAGEDAVAVDAMAAHLTGFNTCDMEFLHMAAQRGMGTMDLDRIDTVGDDPACIRERWAKPRNWYGRSNREWRVTKAPDSDLRSWQLYTAPTDTLHFDRCFARETAAAPTSAAATTIHAEGHRKAVLWAGVSGQLSAMLNGEKVMEQENLGRYRVAQFRAPVELKPGPNLLVFHARSSEGAPRLSALLADPRNDGDSVEGIRWSA
ncbi:MAG: DUF362 domain-containing protein [Bryobacteraceae bacterium]|nr:DUF362 domain-containing protein [Bryobacteraceae bacterium]